MSLTLGMVGKSWIIALVVMAGAVGWALEAPDETASRPAAALLQGNGDVGTALLGVQELRDRLDAHHDPSTALTAIPDLLAVREGVRGHDTRHLARSLDAAGFLVEASAASDPDDPAARAHDLHLAAARGQMHRLQSDQGIGATTPPQQDDPVAAILELADTHDVAVEDLDLAALGTLETLELPLQHALGAVVAAFIAYESADRAVQGPADLPNVVAARSDLVLAAKNLALVMDTIGTQDSRAPLQIANVLSIDLGPGNNAYDDHFLLLIDAGGDDVYRNNAGGSGAVEPRCSLTSGRAAAALIDLRGNDRYIGELDCGSNGGGFNGAGLLYDHMGNDLYRAGSESTNGGAQQQGLGLLLDVRGNDAYEAGDRATNGGADAQALGLLLDGDGSDLYTSGGRATNGGGVLRGIGALIDGAGDDSYIALGPATNGGATEEGLGLLVDFDGADDYVSAGAGTNGGATDLGAGALIDLAGADEYHSTAVGSNGGGVRGGIGLLYDHVGNDHYASGSEGVNGGAYAGGFGFLLDAAGDDRYIATAQAVNGGAAAGSIGSDDPDDEVCPAPLNSCFTPAWSWGLLMDLSGLDLFEEEDEDPSGTDRSVFPKGNVGAQLDFVPELDLPFGGRK